MKNSKKISCYFFHSSVKYYMYNIYMKNKRKLNKERDNYMKKILAIISILFFLMGCTSVYAESQLNTVPQDATGKLIEIKDKELKTMEEYKEAYGSDAYGITAYLLNKVRIYSIPFGFVSIIIAGIYQYIIGLKKLDVRDKGFALMIASVTIVVICQVLPLVFAIVVKGWRG